MSQSREEIATALPTGFSLLDYRISGRFLLATVSFPDEDGDGSWLAVQTANGWSELCLTGGAFDQVDFDEFEVPEEHRAALLDCYRV